MVFNPNISTAPVKQPTPAGSSSLPHILLTSDQVTDYVRESGRLAERSTSLDIHRTDVGL